VEKWECGRPQGCAVSANARIATGFPGRLLLALLTPGGAAGDFSYYIPVRNELEFKVVEEAVAIRVGGTIRLRWLATLAVIRRFSAHFLLCIAAWILLGYCWGQTILHAELTSALIVPLICNVLGIDPGQLMVRGVITLTPTQVYWTNVFGRTRARGWDWIRKAEDVRGDLHIVFGRHRSRAIALKRVVPPPIYQQLLSLLRMNGKLASQDE
jgi:hypothetical protein